MARDSGAKLIAETLAREGIDRVWFPAAARCGELVKALQRAGIEPIGTLTDSGAVAMAMGDGRRSGRPGVVILRAATGGVPGTAALLRAREDGQAVVGIVLSAGRPPAEFPGFDDVALPSKPEHLPSDLVGMIGRAVQESRPMAMVVPDEALVASALRDVPVPERHAAYVPHDPEHGPKMDRVLRLLRQARLVGLHVGPHAASVRTMILELAERLEATLSTAVGARGLVPDSHALSVGEGFQPEAPAWVSRILAGRDLVIAIGARSLPDRRLELAPRPERLVLVDESPAQVSGPKPDVVLVDQPRAFLAAVLDRVAQVPRDEKLRARIAKGKRKQAAGMARDLEEDGVQPQILLSRLRSRLPPDGLLALDGGYLAAWARYAFSVEEPGTLLVPPAGVHRPLSIPLALGALVARPSRPVLAVTDDDAMAEGAFELRLAVERRVPLPVLVVQEIGRRADGSRLPPMDLRALAQALGARAVAIDSDFELDRGLDAALAPGDRPTLCRVRLLAERPPPQPRTAAGRVRYAAASVARRLMKRG